ncbi:hypothetical protein [Porphyrobacter sp. ULC335]|uniref:hypothetical protein n=1 Tax=Porphyrobacter sp. ULC335 TaxID=2854260 RepID=UPI0022204717|nr:hypothetical protein [Porphyrobacter sp. ULC335]UYV14385.1 hypothetical protein KVF90_09340 [Porphyrobacter sp. ULC335]
MSQSFTDAQLAAFLDGTLEDETLIDAIEAAINADPALAARAEGLAAAEPAGSAVRDAYAPVLAAPVPERLVAAVTAREAPDVAQVVDLAAARAAQPRSLPTPANDAGHGSWRWPQFGAMAASLALGVMIGGPLLTGNGGKATGGGELVLASADLDAMLATAPSGQKVDLAALGQGEVVLTFRNADGELCRQFTIAAPAGATSDALACTGGTDAGWQIEAYGRRAAPAGEMKLAGGDAAPAVVAAVDAMIDSDPLIGADELAELGKK